MVAAPFALRGEMLDRVTSAEVGERHFNVVYRLLGQLRSFV